VIAAGLAAAVWAVAFSAQWTERVVEHRQIRCCSPSSRVAQRAELILIEVGYEVEEAAGAP
jgi:hypothetical protein